MADGADGQSQTSAPRSRHTHDNSISLRRASEEDTAGPQEVECTPVLGVGYWDSEEQNNEGETRPFAPRSDGGQAEGPACRNQLRAPDGGWGWMVLVATIVVLALTLAFPSCIGIFYTELQTEFKASNTEISWVPAIMTAVLHAGGPLCSVLVERFGCRVTVMVGGVLSGLGMVLGALARTINDLYITSFITGLGFCLCFQPSVTMMGHYFVRRRAFANALSSTGTALGLSTLPLIANFLLGQFGWRGSFLVLGGVLLNCCVCGALMRPLAPTSGPGKPKFPRGCVNPDSLLRQQDRGGLRDRLKTVLSGFAAFLRRHMAFDLLLSNSRYCAYTVGATWMMLAFMVPIVYLVPYATDNHMELGRAALLMSILGLVNIAVRPIAALLLSLPHFKGSRCFVYLFAAAVLVNGLSSSICGASASFEVLLLYVVTFGISMSVLGSLLFTVLMEIVEMSHFPSALGLICMLQSVTLLIGPPLAGMLLDSTGQYSYVFYACSVVVSSAALFLLGSFYYLDTKETAREALRSLP